MTRARDRLYLGSVTKGGRILPGRGSLAEVLPPTLLEKFNDAVSGLTLEWRATSGAVHRLRVPATGNPLSAIVLPRVPQVDQQDTDLGPAVWQGTRRTTVGAAVASQSLLIGGPVHGRNSDRLVGALVHRLLQRASIATTLDDATMLDLAERLITNDERVDLPDGESVARQAIRSYRALRDHPDVMQLYASGRPLHEVPFSFLADGVFVRGAIDCLVVAPERVTVLEFKTGRRRPEHAAQVEIYRRAAQAMFPDVVTDAWLVYPDEVTA